METKGKNHGHRPLNGRLYVTPTLATYPLKSHSRRDPEPECSPQYLSRIAPLWLLVLYKIPKAFIRGRRRPDPSYNQVCKIRSRKSRNGNLRGAPRTIRRIDDSCCEVLRPYEYIAVSTCRKPPVWVPTFPHWGYPGARRWSRISFHFSHVIPLYLVVCCYHVPK